MSEEETSRYVRLRVDLVLEIEDADELAAAALGRIAEDPAMRPEERAHAEAAVREDGAEALAYLVDPVDLVEALPGAELVQASWSSERVGYDPDDEEWDLDEEDSNDDE
ncbi:hypothetical protein ACFYZ9_16005 [Streptomyces sp. NPDC001691]|uniref:hypothetical protein n=1 Tax=unclassified Streptomyces TaxID=2593676 RepID=UPI000DEB7CAD|nr:hypothetical protein [Streptomyces sp. SDr-06]RCH67989.1 hypothetical protein DT019_13365 [Streptomyces sp. SDr-06]